MVFGMASQKVTITLDAQQVARIKALVAQGKAQTVSGFVSHSVGLALDDVAGWGAILGEGLDKTGGAISDAERIWADEVLGVRKKRKRVA
jgi:Arc/MetJ-type ribon-helix-helix transcriptional regulator